MENKKVTIKNNENKGMNKLLNPVKPEKVKSNLDEILKEIEEIQKETDDN